MVTVDPFIVAEAHAVHRTWREGLDPKLVLEGFEFLRGLAPDVAEGWSGAGEAFLALGMPREALVRHARAVELAPGDPAVRAGRGAALAAAGRERAAIIDLRVAAALDPVRPRAWERMADCLAATGRPADADRARSEAASTRGEIAEARAGSWSPRLRRRWRWVVASGPNSVARRADDPRAWWRVAILLRLTGRPDEEREVASAARRLSDEPSSQLDRAQILSRLPTLPDAVERGTPALPLHELPRRSDLA